MVAEDLLMSPIGPDLLGTSTMPPSTKSNKTTEYDRATLERKLEICREREGVLRSTISEVARENELLRGKLRAIEAAARKKEAAIASTVASLRGASVRQVVEMYEHSRQSLLSEVGSLRQTLSINAASPGNDVISAEKLRALLGVSSESEIIPTIERLVGVLGPMRAMEEWVAKVCVLVGAESPESALVAIQAATRVAASDSGAIQIVEKCMAMLDVPRGDMVVRAVQELFLDAANSKAEIRVKNTQGSTSRSDPRILRTPRPLGL
eukprot:ANDGO_02854.mRNA.1 hypothetical protein